ncbi:MAG: phage late control D family protein [Nitrospirales bacterium]|nr:phage late control D family protein [Nitrospirales bacterium]
MALETISPGMMSFYAPRFEIEINNSRLAADISKAIMDITINEKMDEGADFSMTVNDEFDMTKQQFKWLDHPLFEIGNRMNIRIGYGGTMEEIMLGKITSLEPSFFSGELPTITVTGQDLSYDILKRAARERTFLNLSYGDIARRIASEAEMQAVIDDTPVFEPFIRKNNNETYYAFLESLAARAGFTFAVDRRTMSFIRPRDDRREVLTLELGKDLISFRPRMNTTDLVTEVEVRGHDANDPNTPIVGRAQAGSERILEPGRQTASQFAAEHYGEIRSVLTGLIVNSTEHANTIAASELNRRSDGFIEGDVECIGIPQIRPGVTIKIEKVGKKFSGKYYVKSASHSIGNSGYKLRFTVKRNAL